MTKIIRIKSMRYHDQLVVGPVDADLEALEEEWAAPPNSGGTLIHFIEWLRSHKGFTLVAGEEYKFNRG